MTAYTMQTAHHEIALEQHLVDRLVDRELAARRAVSRGSRGITTGRSPSTASWFCNS